MRWLAAVNLEDEEAKTVVAGVVALAERAPEPPIVDLVYAATPGGAPSWITDPLSRQALLESSHAHRARERLHMDELARAIPDALRGSATIEEGRPTTVLADRAKSAALIALAGRRRGDLDRLLLGSVAARIARTSEVPVLIVPGHTASAGAAATVPGDTGSMLPADDPTGSVARPARSDRRALLGVDLRAADAGAGLDTAARWCQRLGLALDLVHVDHERLHVPYVLDPDVRARLQREWEALRERDITTLQDLLRRVPEPCRGSPRVEEGDPADMLCELADGYDVVFVATHGRTGMERLMVGSVAERLIPRCPRPVLLLRA